MNENASETFHTPAPATQGTSALALDAEPAARPSLSLVGGTEVELREMLVDGLLPWHRELLEGSIHPSMLAAAKVRTVLKRNELPAHMQWTFDWGSGILFEHQTIDTGAPEYQFRPDREGEFPQRVDPGPAARERAREYEARNAGKAPKYFFGKGASNGPWVITPHMIEGRYHTTETTKLIVEGTKPYLAVAAWADYDAAVLGIGGCSGGRKHGKGFVPAWAMLGIRGSHVVVALDADMTANVDVWYAAASLRDHLLTLGALSVKFATFPVLPEYDPDGTIAADPKRGADDVLNGVPEAERAAFIQRAIDEAGDLPEAPAKDYPAALIDHSAGTIREAKIDYETDTVRPGRELMNAAVSIDTVHVTRNLVRPGSAPEYEYGLRVTVNCDGEMVPSHVAGVSDAGLSDTRAWLKPVEGGFGVSVSTRDKDTVLGAIRKEAITGAKRIEARAHTGWEETDTIGYSHPGGRVIPPDTTAPGFSGYRGQSGVMRTITSNTVLKQLTLVDVADASAAFKAADPQGREGVHAGVDLLLTVGEMMVNPVGWDLTLGSIGAAYSGVAPRGALCLAAEPGSGKTTLMLLFGQRMFGLHKNYRSFRATEAIVDDMHIGIHHGLLHVEDVKDMLGEGGPAAVAKQNGIVAGLLGMAYDGPGGQKDKKAPSAAGGWAERGVDISRVHVSLSAELDAIPYGAKSAIQRTLFVRMDKSHMTIETAKKLEGMAEDNGDLLEIMGSYLISALAANIAEGKDATGKPHGGPATLENYLRATNLAVRATVDELLETELGKFKAGRYAHAPSRAVLGVRIWADAMRRAAAVPGGEHLLPRIDKWEAEAFGRLVHASVDWREFVANKTNYTEGKIIDSLKSLIRAGRARLAVHGNINGIHPDPYDRNPAIGSVVFKRKEGRYAIALNLEEIARLLPAGSKPVADRAEEVRRILDPLLIRQGDTKQIKVGDQRLPAIWMADWCGEGKGAGLPEVKAWVERTAIIAEDDDEDDYEEDEDIAEAKSLIQSTLGLEPAGSDLQF